MTRLGLRKLFAKLLCQLGRIAEIGIIYVRVLRDDRLDSAAHPVRGLALGQPDGLKQFVDVARPDLRDRQLSDGGVGVAFKRSRPLVAVLLAPGRPLRAYIGLGAFLERRCCALRFHRLGLLPCLAAFLHDVHAGCAAITLDA